MQAKPIIFWAVMIDLGWTLTQHVQEESISVVKAQMLGGRRDFCPVGLLSWVPVAILPSMWRCSFCLREKNETNTQREPEQAKMRNTWRENLSGVVFGPKFPFPRMGLMQLFCPYGELAQYLGLL